MIHFKSMIDNIQETISTIITSLYSNWMIKVVVACISAIFLPISEQIVILFGMLVLDTILGSSVAISFHRFSSSGFRQILSKSMVYIGSLIATRLAEMAFLGNSTILTSFMVGVLGVTEFVSILENLTLLGAPIPKTFFNLLVKQINIIDIKDIVLHNNSLNEVTQEVDDIMKHHIPLLEDTKLQKLLFIKFNVWREFLRRIYELNISETDCVKLKLKIGLLFNQAMKDMNREWEQANISKETIDSFTITHQPKVECFTKSMEIMFATCNEKTQEQKRLEICNTLVRLLYQTITEAQKGLYSYNK